MRELFNAVILVLALSVFLVLAYRYLRIVFVRRRISPGKLESVTVLSDRVILPKPVLLARGVTKIIAVRGIKLSAVLSTRSIQVGDPEERIWLSTSEICWKPPSVKVLDTVEAELPSYIVVEGSYKGLILACFDTTSLKARGEVEAVSEAGYVRSLLRVERGIVRARLEWAAPAHISTFKPGRVVLEVCTSGFTLKTCAEILDLGKPGSIEGSYEYPVLRRIYVGDSTGRGLESVAELSQYSMRILPTPGSVMRVKYKPGIARQVVLKEVVVS